MLASMRDAIYRIAPFGRIAMQNDTQLFDELQSLISWQKRDERVLQCPVCEVADRMRFVVEVASSYDRSQRLQLFQCRHCESMIFPDFQQPDYQVAHNTEAYLQFYLEVGAGIDQIIRHVYCVPRTNGMRYLEIGCGFGFALDFARHALSSDVLGIDPSPYGIAGARLLDLPIMPVYLDDSTPVDRNSYDLVVASEVIEHIQDPLPFLRSVKSLLANSGSVVLTTPNAAAINPTTPLGALIPALSAGWHCIIYSKQGLEHVLRRASFENISVEVRDNTLVAGAAIGPNAVALSSEIDRLEYRDYLQSRANTSTDGPLKIGLTYRLFKELVNGGRYDAALKVARSLSDCLSATYNLNFEGEIDGLLKPQTFDAFAKEQPLCLAGVLYFRGIIAMNFEEDRPRAASLFLSAFKVGARLRALLNQIGIDDAETENIVKDSQLLYLLALAYQSPKMAVQRLKEYFPLNGPKPGPLETYVATARLFVHIVNLGHLEVASELFFPIKEQMKDMMQAGVSRMLAIDLHRTLGLMEINYHSRPRQAALQFALSERLARRQLADDPQATGYSIWDARYNRILAWMVAANARRALIIAKCFDKDKDERGNKIPKEIADKVFELTKITKQ
jgi:2-polyprenyl-3-methyl-5-hydroxy-6-metoxy-1,4-benzoquinol methylase